MNHRQIMLITLIVTSLVLLTTLATANEPTRPAFDRTFDIQKEAKIRELTRLSLKKAHTRLKSADFLVNEDLLHEAIFTAFEYRKTEAIAHALDYLKSPITQIIDHKLVSRSDDFYIAKKILQVFPDKAIDSLLKLYRSSYAVTKGNVIRVLGTMAGGPAIRDLLIGALDDKTFCEEKHPEMSGQPLRICDVAYNQLVLRYKIKDVLRTIGTAHRIENRDYHIDILKSKL